MKRWVAISTIAVAAVVLALGAARGSGSPQRAAKTTITAWVYFSNPELQTFKQVVSQFEKTHPAIKVKVVGGIDDTKILAAIRGGNAPDFAQSSSSDYTGSYCSTGAFIDLGPYMKRDHVSAGIFPSAARYYTQYNGKRCALPMLADVYGLYYNKTLLKKAHIARPPRTITELTADAKKLTKRGKGGSLKVVGFNPYLGWYENAEAHYGPAFGAKWVDAKGRSILSKDTGWQRYLRWEKKLVDWYGYSNLVRFNAGSGDEFSASNAFERGKVAMHLDGEWRVSFLRKEHPELKYGVVPFPVDDAKKHLYGGGYTTGSIIGIPRNAHHKDEAWELLKYLATDTRAEAMLSNGILNVPTTTAAAHSKLLKPNPKFAVFIRIFNNPHTMTTPVTPIGAANQNLFASFTQKWQAGHAKDLVGGLRKVDSQVNAQLKQAGAGVP